MRAQIYSQILAPIFFFLTLGTWILIVKYISKSKHSVQLTYFQIAKENNLHIYWFLLIANEILSQIAFGGFATTGVSYDSINTGWALIRTGVYLILIFADLSRLLRLRDRSLDGSKVSLLLLLTEFLAIFFAMLFIAR